MREENVMKKWIIGAVVLAGLTTTCILIMAKNKREKAEVKNRLQGSDFSGGEESNKEHLGDDLVEPNWSNPISSHYMSEVIRWATPKKVLKLTDKYADKLAQEIHKAKGRFILSNDNEDAVASVFGQKLKDKVQVSNVAQAFFKRYKKDLKKHLQSFLSESELQTHVYKPIARLKNYREA